MERRGTFWQWTAHYGDARRNNLAQRGTILQDLVPSRCRQPPRNVAQPGATFCRFALSDTQLRNPNAAFLCLQPPPTTTITIPMGRIGTIWNV